MKCTYTTQVSGGLSEPLHMLFFAIDSCLRVRVCRCMCIQRVTCTHFLRLCWSGKTHVLTFFHFSSNFFNDPIFFVRIYNMFAYTLHTHIHKRSPDKMCAIHADCVVCSEREQPHSATKLSWLSRACVCVYGRWKKPFCYVFSSTWNSVYWLFGLGPIHTRTTIRTHTFPHVRLKHTFYYAHTYVHNTIK